MTESQLKLVRLPLPLAATLAALPSISEIPFLDSWFSDFISSGKAILWRSVVDAFAAGHDTWSRVGHLRWSIVIASIAGGVRVRLMCSGERCRAKMWSLRRANRARFRTRIGFVPLQRVAARICFSKTAKIPTQSISRSRLWTIRHHLRRRKRSSSKINCPG